METSQNPLDKPLEEAVANTVASDPIDGAVHVLDRRDLARRAALAGFRQAIDLVAKSVAEMAADQGCRRIQEAAEPIRALPNDVP